MQTPLEVDFQGLAKTPQVEDAIAKHVAQLEQRYGRVTSCRVALRAPSGHHQNGGLYEVSIHLALPNGRDVNVGRTATADERHAERSRSTTRSSARGGGCRITPAGCAAR